MSKSSEAVKKWRETTKARMVLAMGSKCQCCGYNTCNGALAFHHLDPTIKDLGFGAIRGNPVSWKKIVIELRKCILVCHNCHSEIHAGVRDIPATYTAFDESMTEYDISFEQEYDSCICGLQKPISRKFCSNTCAATNRRKVKWETIDLLTLLKTHSIGELEDMFGVTNSAIYKQRDKLLKKV